MTIELRVPFSDKEKAKSFQEFLKKNGCQARIVTDSKYDEVTEYSAPIGVIEKFLDDIQERNSNEEDWDEELDDDIESTRDWISDFKEDIEKFYSVYEVGKAHKFDYIFENVCGYNPDSLQDDEDNFDTDGVLDAYDKFNKINKILSFSQILITLNKNACISNENEDHEITLIEKKPIEELVLETEEDELLGSFNPDDLDEGGIEMHTVKTIGYRYTVIAGPEYLKINPYELRDTITEDADNPFEFDDALEDFASSLEFLHCVLDLIMNGNSTIQEIQEGLSKVEDEVMSVYRVSNEYLSDVLADLKKLGLITIKNGVIKPAK